MQTTESNELVSISIKNKPITIVVYIWLILSLYGMSLIYILFKNMYLTLFPLLIFIVVSIFRKFTFYYRIVLGDNIFEISMTIMGIEYSNIKFVYDKFILNQNAIYFYQKNQTERLSVIFTADPELDYIQVNVENGKSIQIDSNEESGIIFGQLVRKLENKNIR